MSFHFLQLGAILTIFSGALYVQVRAVSVHFHVDNEQFVSCTGRDKIRVTRDRLNRISQSSRPLFSYAWNPPHAAKQPMSPTLTSKEQIAIAGATYEGRHNISCRTGLVAQVLRRATGSPLSAGDSLYTIGIMTSMSGCSFLPSISPSSGHDRRGNVPPDRLY